jgi:hypothetical protein
MLRPVRAISLFLSKELVLLCEFAVCWFVQARLGFCVGCHLQRRSRNVTVHFGRVRRCHHRVLLSGREIHKDDQSARWACAPCTACVGLCRRNTLLEHCATAGLRPRAQIELGFCSRSRQRWQFLLRVCVNVFVCVCVCVMLMYVLQTRQSPLPNVPTSR